MTNLRQAAVAAIILMSVVVFICARAGMAVAVQPTASPDSVNVTIDQVDISLNDVDDYHTLFTASSMAFDGNGTNEIGRGDVPVGTYRALRVTISGMSWSVASWGTTNRSPCTGDTAGADNGPVDLGGHTIFYFKTPDLGGNTPAYYRAHPPDLTSYVGDASHPFVLPSPIIVSKGHETHVDLRFDVDHTLSCNSVSLYTLVGGGPLSTIAGSKTRLTDVDGAVLDPYADRIGVTNRGNHSVTFFNRMDSDDVAPVRSLIGPATLLNEPSGAALLMNQADHTQDELFVANRGNNSISVFDRSSTGNSAPLRSISGLFTELNRPEGVAVDAVNNELVVANSGNDSVTFYDRDANQDAFPLHSIIGSQTGFSQPSGVALRPDPVDPAAGAIVVANYGNNSVTIYDRNGLLTTYGQLRGGAGAATSMSSGNTLSVALNGDIPHSIAFGPSVTADGVAVAAQIQNKVRALASIVSSQLRPAYLNFTAFFDLSTTSYTLTSGASGSDSAVVVTGGSSVDALKLSEGQGAIQIDGTNVAPVMTLAGFNTQLNGPSAVAVYTDPVFPANDEIVVANEGLSPGAGTITIYGWNAVMNSADGNVAPVTTINGLNTPDGLYLDAARGQIGVVHAGDQVVMAFQPAIVPAGSNVISPGKDNTGSVAALSGDYHVVVYGVDLKAVNRRGFVIPVVISERGMAHLDGDGGLSLLIDTQLGRQVLEADCLAGPDVGVTQTGSYGVNDDGSFYMLLPGTGGSVHGAFLPDGNVFVGSVYDSADHLRLIYGVRTSVSAPYLTSDGTSTGFPTHYGFASYRDDLFTVGRFDNDVKTVDTLRHLLGIGMAETDAASFIGVSNDANFVESVNPVGEAGDPKSGGPIYRQGFNVLELPTQLYDNSTPGGGTIHNQADGVTGAATADGATLIFARDTTTQDSNGCPTDIGFGMGLRQRPSGTFRASSLKGTYFVAAFGDLFNVSTQRSQHRVTALALTFDGSGKVQLAETDNQDGMISTDQALLTYQVHPKAVPVDGGTIEQVDVVDLYDRVLSGPTASALIGENGQSLIFFRSLNQVHTPSLIRLLGLGLFQHS
jgi:hypothetical protein